MYGPCMMNFYELRNGYKKNYNKVEPCSNKKWPFALFALLGALVCVLEFFFCVCVFPDL